MSPIDTTRLTHHASFQAYHQIKIRPGVFLDFNKACDGVVLGRLVQDLLKHHCSLISRNYVWWDRLHIFLIIRLHLMGRSCYRNYLLIMPVGSALHYKNIFFHPLCPIRMPCSSKLLFLLFHFLSISLQISSIQDISLQIQWSIFSVWNDLSHSLHMNCLKTLRAQMPNFIAGRKQCVYNFVSPTEQELCIHFLLFLLFVLLRLRGMIATLHVNRHGLRHGLRDHPDHLEKQRQILLFQQTKNWKQLLSDVSYFFVILYFHRRGS